MEPQQEDSLVVVLVLLFFYSLPILLLFGTYFIGRSIEKRHYKSIKEREGDWNHIPAITGKDMSGLPQVASAELAIGSVVVSIDHFKRWLSGFRKIFGGEMKSYSSVIDRGRREAILRMKETCPDADMFLNCRIMTSTISNGKGKAIGCSEVMAYATAIRFQQPEE